MTLPADTREASEVTIVGAGPIGLLLAGELAAHDIRVVVLERDVAPSTIPKANGIVGHAAVELARRGILSGTGLRVVSPPRFQFGPLPLKLGIGPGNPLHILPIPQRRLEEILEHWATARGTELRRGQEVIGFAQTDSGVTIDVRAGEMARSVRARYLVGCDGAHSLVRKQARIGFPGFTSDGVARIARVTIPADQITHTGDSFDIAGVGRLVAMRPNPLRGGGFSIALASALDRSTPKDLYIVSTHEPRGNAEASESVSTEELRASLRRVLGGELPFTEATAISSVVGNSRQADAYRRGRVFLAGDAAHVFNAGGSSLNAGMLDVLDLAPRLVAALRDSPPANVLDGYQAARHPAGQHVLLHTRAQAVLSRNDETGRALREIVSDLVTSRRAARHLARLIEDG